MKFEPGDQIVYVPSHVPANYDLAHPDIEFGFVSIANNDDVLQGHEGAVFCRYWMRDHIGTLRTTANSELTPIANLRHYNSVDQWIIDAWFQKQKDGG